MPNSNTVLVLSVTVLLATPMSRADAQAPYRLTLREAIEKGLQNNLRVLVAHTQIEETEGTRQRRLAALLPMARAESLANLQTRNLEAFGISIPGRPAVVGPFSNYDFRIYGDQPLLDMRSYYRWKASEKQKLAVQHAYQDIRDLIIQQVASLYLDAQAAFARVEAAASRVTTAQTLYQLALDQRDAGAATGVDVLRAQVELANERQRLLEARNAARQVLLGLSRAIGLAQETPLELAEPLTYKPIVLPEIQSALAAAMLHRADYLSLQVQQEALRSEARSNQARKWPRLSLGANYGAVGRSLGDLEDTGTLQGTVTINLFDWDRRGERVELESRRRRLEYEIADMRQGIEQQIRDALLTLESATEEVNVAEQGRALALRELELVRDRFQAGVTDNVEVVSAQEALARAQENRIVALTRYASAKMALARALGNTEEAYERYLGIP